eukprot:2157069-Pyramimonas_sp.AAC.1
MWATEVHGLYRSSLKRFCGIAHASSSARGRGTCCAAAIRWTFGAGRDPVQVRARRLVAAGSGSAPGFWS